MAKATQTNNYTQIVPNDFINLFMKLYSAKDMLHGTRSCVILKKHGSYSIPRNISFLMENSVTSLSIKRK